MKKVAAWIMKAIAGGVAALLALNAFCMLYYNVPVHYTNPDGSTEYKWESSSFYSKGTEGFAWGVTNNDGFNNLKDYTPGEKIDILLMGSSHMEGFNVAQDENAAAVLNELFAGEKYTYNIGTAGHTLLYCIKHLDAALDTYAPAGYVVIEAASVDFAAEDMEAVVNGTFADIPSHTGALITLLQKLPFLRLFYTKMFKDADAAAAEPAPALPQQSTGRDYRAELGPLLDMVAGSCREHGVQPVIVYDTDIRVDAQGRAYTTADEDRITDFAAVCDEKGIAFVDTRDSFIENYNSTYELPCGFSNTSPGAGHINRVGHRLFALDVYGAITGLEGR